MYTRTHTHTHTHTTTFFAPFQTSILQTYRCTRYFYNYIDQCLASSHYVTLLCIQLTFHFLESRSLSVSESRDYTQLPPY